MTEPNANNAATEPAPNEDAVIPYVAILLKEGVVRDLGDRWELSLESAMENQTQIDPAKFYFPKKLTGPQFRLLERETNIGNMTVYARLMGKVCFSGKEMRSRGVAEDYIDRLTPDDFMNCMALMDQVVTASLPKYGRRIS